MKHLFIALLLTSLFGCVAPKPLSISKHPGQTTVQKPSMNEVNDDVWYMYWADQLDAYEGNVAMPTDEYPESAKRGYYRAKTEYKQKYDNAVQKNWVKRTFLLPGIAIAALLLILPSGN